MKCVLPTILCCAAVGGLYANQSSLITQSPFLPENYNREDHTEERPQTFQQIPQNHFVLKGVAQLSGVFHFSIFDSQSQRSAWITPGETFNGLTALEFDQIEQHLIARYNNTKQTIGFNTADDRSLMVQTSVQTSHSSIIAEAPIGNRRPIAFRVPQGSYHEISENLEANDPTSHPYHPLFASTYGTEAPPSTLDIKSNDFPDKPVVESTVSAEKPTPTHTRFGIDQSRISKTW